MARQPRFALPGVPQHLIQRGNNRNTMFFDDWDRRFFLRCLHEGCEEQRCRVHAYVLMTNHVHILATPETGTGLSKLMQSVGRRYVGFVNARHGRSGTLWEGRYRATAVDTEGYLLTCYRYVELNPVRAGLVTDPAAYNWSSHACNALGRPDAVVRPHEVYSALGRDPQERLATYRSLFDVAMEPGQVDEIRQATHKGWALGSAAFCGRVEAVSGRPCTPGPRGGVRPGAGRKATKIDGVQKSMGSDTIDY